MTFRRPTNIVCVAAPQSLALLCEGVVDSRNYMGAFIYPPANGRLSSSMIARARSLKALGLVVLPMHSCPHTDLFAGSGARPGSFAHAFTGGAANFAKHGFCSGRGNTCWATTRFVDLCIGTECSAAHTQRIRARLARDMSQRWQRMLLC